MEIEAIPYNGYHFKRWQDGNTDNPRSYTLWQTNRNFIAEFELDKHQITLSCEASHGAVIGDQGKFNYGTEHTIEAVPNYGYHFTQWSDGETENPRTFTLEQDTTFTAEFAKNIYAFNVTCDNSVGTIEAQNGNYEYLTEVPLKAIPNEHYHFVQWSDGVEDNPRTLILTQDTVLTAEFAKDVFVITFVNYDGTELQSGEVEYGVVPSYTGETPIKPADEQYSYTFAGWDAEVVAVTGEATYTAVFESTLNKYLVKFLNYDGSELQSGDVEYGVVPVYAGDTPTKPADAQYTYTFTGWDAEVVAVTGEATYTAVFESTLNKVNITWQDEDGNPILEEQVEIGTTPVFSGETPTKAATNEYTYEFAGWLPKIKPATEDVRYTTFFERNKIETPVYTVTINGENCSLNISNECPEGTKLTVEAVADECFEFRKWSDDETANPRTINVTEDTDLTAEFNKVRYTITGKAENEGGQVQVVNQ